MLRKAREKVVVPRVPGYSFAINSACNDWKTTVVRATGEPLNPAYFVETLQSRTCRLRARLPAVSHTKPPSDYPISPQSR